MSGKALGVGTVLATPTGTGTSGGGYTPSTKPVVKPKGSRVPSSSVSIDRPDMGTTQAITNAVYQNLMGRDAKLPEIEKIHAAYLQYAASHPMSSSSGGSVVDATTGQVTSNQSTSVSSGTSERDFIGNLVNGKAEARAYTAASGYLDAMQKEMSRFNGGL